MTLQTVNPLHFIAPHGQFSYRKSNLFNFLKHLFKTTTEQIWHICNFRRAQYVHNILKNYTILKFLQKIVSTKYSTVYQIWHYSYRTREL